MHRHDEPSTRWIVFVRSPPQGGDARRHSLHESFGVISRTRVRLVYARNKLPPAPDFQQQEAIRPRRTGGRLDHVAGRNLSLRHGADKRYERAHTAIAYYWAVRPGDCGGVSDQYLRRIPRGRL